MVVLSVFIISLLPKSHSQYTLSTKNRNVFYRRVSFPTVTMATEIHQQNTITSQKGQKPTQTLQTTNRASENVKSTCNGVQIPFLR